MSNDEYHVDGWYKYLGNLEEEGRPDTKREIRKYHAKSPEDAVRIARNDGLVQGIMVEQILGEPQKCVIPRTLPPNIEDLLRKRGWLKS